MRWREAMAGALYGEGGFFVAGPGPGGHFRTSVHASDVFGAAILRLLSTVDKVLGTPERLDVVDVGAGRGELLRALAGAAPDGLRDRLRLRAVELAPRPADLPDAIGWSAELPDPGSVTGLVLATEWLDNVPVDIVEVDEAGVVRYVLVDGVGPEPDEADAAWLRAWWPLSQPGTRAEVGRTRDEAWAAAVGTLAGGLALSVDYGHTGTHRPPLGSLTGFRDGREVAPVPDGSCDLTADVALDAVAAAGGRVAGAAPTLMPQHDALRALGVSGRRPALDRAARDPVGYVRALAAATAAAELTDPTGLGGHVWLVQPVGLNGFTLG